MHLLNSVTEIFFYTDKLFLTRNFVVPSLYPLKLFCSRGEYIINLQFCLFLNMDMRVHAYNISSCNECWCGTNIPVTALSTKYYTLVMTNTNTMKYLYSFSLSSILTHSFPAGWYSTYHRMNEVIRKNNEE